jgi:hypothetical protein
MRDYSSDRQQLGRSLKCPRSGRKIVSKTEEYRAKAADCEKKAAEATDLEAKRLLQEAAKVWRDMAAQPHQDRS